jgi:hypothetical protein
MSELLGVKVKSIVEIGVFQGRTSQQFRCLFPDAFLYLIDPWKLYDEYLSETAGPISRQSNDYEDAYQKVKKVFSQDPKVQIIRKASAEALLDVPDGVDLIFIDGNHSYLNVKQDIESWVPKVRRGGIISGHDYNAHRFPEVIKAVDEFFPEGVSIGHNDTWFKHKA